MTENGELPERPVTVAPTADPHPPRRYFLTELLIVTAGVLIALSVDSLREWNQNRTLVSEARRNITEEIENNNRDLETALKGIEARRAELESALTLINELLATRKSSIKELQLGTGLLEVSDANWRSAERTGALAHMSYADVQKYSELYEMQALYADHRRRHFERLGLAIGAIDGDPHKAAPKDLERLRDHLLLLRGDLFIGEKLGRSLSEAYRRTLKQ